MARYFFHIEDGRAECDSAGTELPNFSQVVPEAVGLMAQTLRDRPSKLTDTEDLVIRVQDEGGLTLLTVHTILTYAPAANIRS